MQIEKLHDVYLAFGSNLGNKEENILQAIKYLNERVGMVIAYSAFYITEPVGFESENDFVNAACLLMTSLTPTELLEATQQIELQMGRGSKSENEVYADRTIDIDILLYDELVLESGGLVLPHPHLHERGFVLHPLAELAGHYVHPILKKTIYQLEEGLND